MNLQIHQMDGAVNIIGTTLNIDKTQLCTSRSCSPDRDQYKLQCTKCQHLVHYKCSHLPSYEVHLFVTTGYRKFICANCVEVPQYIMDLVPSVQTPTPRHTKTMTEQC